MMCKLDSNHQHEASLGLDEDMYFFTELRM